MEKGYAMQTAGPAKGFHSLKDARQANFFERADNSVAIYTASCLLKRVGERYGLQAMDAYLSSYIKRVDQCEPKLKDAVDQAVSMIDIEKMYRESVVRSL